LDAGRNTGDNNNDDVGDVRQTQNRIRDHVWHSPGCGEKMSSEVYAIEREVDQLKADGKIPEAIEKMKEALAIDDTFARGHLTLARETKRSFRKQKKPRLVLR